MEKIQEILQQIDWKVVIPLITLLIGYLLGTGKDFLDRRRKVNNLRFVIKNELLYNYAMLLVISNEESENVITYFVHIDGLSLIVFKEYFGRIDALPRNELIRTYQSFRHIHDLKQRKDEIKMRLDTMSEEMSVENILSFLKSAANSSLESTENALLSFSDGREIVSSAKNKAKEIIS